jgi:hypothetical protein
MWEEYVDENWLPSHFIQMEHCNPANKVRACDLLKSYKAGEKMPKLDVAKAKATLTKPQFMTSFFHKKSSNEVSNEQISTQLFQTSK